MKRKNAKKIIAVSLIASVLMIIFTIASFQVVQAADVLEFKPQVPIPGMSATEPVGTTIGNNVVSTLLPKYIQVFYNYGLSVAGILAAVMLMAGGTLWLVSGGDSGKVGQAKDIISGSLIGLVILFSTWIILNTINPELLKMKPLSMSGVGGVEEVQEVRFGCCECKISALIIKTEQSCISNVGLTAEECNTFCEASEKTVQAFHAITNPAAALLITGKEEHKWGYKCGVNENELNTCVEYTANQSLRFQENFSPTDWIFDPGIEKQVGDLSPELAQFLNCMRSILPSGAGRISSISDSNYIGNLSSCNLITCAGSNPKCVHRCGSCHYGGGLTTNKSYAVDFGDEENMVALKTAAIKCDSRAYVLDEGNHLHVSVSKCPRN